MLLRRFQSPTPLSPIVVDAKKSTLDHNLASNLIKAEEKILAYRTLYETALARELSLATELFDLNLRVIQLIKEKVIPRRSTFS